MIEAPQPAAATQIDSRLIDLAFPVTAVISDCNIDNKLTSYKRVCHVRKNVMIGTTACLNCVYCKGHVRAVSEQGTPERYVLCERAWQATNNGTEQTDKQNTLFMDRTEFLISAQAAWELQKICGFVVGKTYWQHYVLDRLEKCKPHLDRDTYEQASNERRCLVTDDAAGTVTYLPNYPSGSSYIYQLKHHNASNDGFLLQYIYVFGDGSFTQSSCWATVGIFLRQGNETPKQYIVRVSGICGAKIETEYIKL
jgi:hypothetical protein